MRAWSEWHFEHVVATLGGATGERASETGRMPCAPWQSEQVATRVSPADIRFPWVLVRYCWY